MPTRTLPPPACKVLIKRATLAFTSLMTGPILPVVSIASTRSRSESLAGEAGAQLFQWLWLVGIGVVGAGLKASVAARYSVVITCPAGSGKEDLFEWKTVG